MQYVNGLDVAEAIYQEVNSIFKNKSLKWEEVKEAEENGCKVLAVDNPLYEGGLLFKCTGIVNCPSDIPWNILYKVENQMKWDKFCIKSKTVEIYDQLNFIDFIAYASPAAGVPRYFSLFRTCKMNFQNKVHCQVYRSIDHSGSEKEIGGNLSGVETFIELKPSGWFIEEIEPNVTKITFITNLPASSMDSYLPNISREEMREMYRKSAMHCRFKIPDLINHIKINYTSQIDRTLTPYNYRTLEIFKEVCDVIGTFDADKWSFFRKIGTLECYYKDISNEPSTVSTGNDKDLTKVRLLYSDSFVINSSLEIIQSFLFSKNSHLVDSWTYNIELVETITQETEIFRICFRSILNPSVEISHYVLKQINQLPTGVLFVGYKSIYYKGQSAEIEHPFWNLPSGFIITPLNNCGQWLVRSIVQTDTIITSRHSEDILTYCMKRKILWSFSEKTSHFHQSLRSVIAHYNCKKIKPINFPHWNTLGEKSFDELVDLFFKLAISHTNEEEESDSDESLCSSNSSETSSISSSSNPSSPTLSPINKSLNINLNLNSNISSNSNINPNINSNTNTNTNSNSNSNTSHSLKKKIDRKRKFIEHEKTSIVSVNQTFTFSNSKRNDVIQPLPFTPNWENYIKKKPFLLLVNSKKSLEPSRKLFKSSHPVGDESTFYILPSEILNYILTFLSAQDLLSMSRTCKLLHKSSTNDYLWKELFERKWNNYSIFNFNINLNDTKPKFNSPNFIHINSNISESSSFDRDETIGISPDLSNSGNSISQQEDEEQEEIEQGQKEVELNMLNDPTLSNDSSLNSTTTNTNNHTTNDLHSNFGTWRKLYVLKDSIEINWKNGNPRTSLLKGHESKINCLQFNQDSLLTASKDRELRVWNLSLKKCDTILKTNSNSNLIAFEKDNFSKWSNEIFPYCLYNPEILRLGFMNGQILNLNIKTQTISSSQRFSFLADGFVFDKLNVYIWESGNMQLWDQNTGQKTHNLTLDTKIKQFKLNRNDMRALACCDKSVKLWDANSNTITHQFQGHKGIVNNIDFYGDHSLISTACKNVRLWDTRNPNMSLDVLTNHTSKVNGLSTSLSSQRFTTTDSTNLLTWQSTPNFSNVSLLSSIPLNQEFGSVDCLAMDDESIVVGYSKGTVAFLDFYN